MDSTKKAVIVARLKAWYLSRGIAIPPTETFAVMVHDILEDCAAIPGEYLDACFADAKRTSQYCPRGPEINNSWVSHIKPNIKPAPMLEAPKKHSCEFCGIVAMRIGLHINEPTEKETEAASNPITQEEIDCLKNGIGSNKFYFEYWNTHKLSPYKGLL